ncbi:flagellar motor switch protein FliG [bacterium]|nr:flagellar motor switch protein FliG [bacterium]
MPEQPNQPTVNPILEKVHPVVKGLAILSVLDEDVASEVFRRFTDTEIRELGTYMTELSMLGRDQLLEIFKDFLSEAGEDVINIGQGGEYLKRIATNVLGEGKAKRLLGISESDQPRLKSLINVEARTIANLIQKEHPQTIALILAYTDPVKSAEILTLLEEETRLDVVLRIAKLDTISPEIIQVIEEALYKEIKAMGSTNMQKAGGVNMVAEIFNNMDKATEGGLMENIEDLDPNLAEEIKQLMFVFDDLMHVDDKAIQTMLKEVENDMLIFALKTAQPELQQKIFKNMSTRAAEYLKDDLEMLGPVKLSDVEKAQQGIVNVALRLEDEGKIVLGGKGGEPMV